jgi:hypothetical protein
MDKHCVSLELAKQMKEAGFNKETEFWWVHNKIRDTWEIKYGLSECIKEHQESWEHYPAPLATEILEELPNELGNLKELTIHKLPEEKWRVNYWDDEKLKCIQKFDKSLPNALAKLWLYLRKEKII